MHHSYRPSYPAITNIHSRMPLMLDLESAKKWLSTQSKKEELNALFENYPAPMRYREVHSDIGNARSKIKSRPILEEPVQSRLI